MKWRCVGQPLLPVTLRRRIISAAFVIRRIPLVACAISPTAPAPPPAPDEFGEEDLSGRALRGYELGERTGTGGFGVVYHAVQCGALASICT